MRMMINKYGLTVLLAALGYSSSASALASGVPIEGTILKADSSPVTGSVQFKVQVRTPDTNNCLMYEESQSVTMSPNGGFSLTLNDGTGSRLDSSGYSFDRVFSNAQGTINAFSFIPATCTSGSSYIAGTNDGRSIVVSFKDSTMVSFEPIPQQSVSFVPYAIEAKQIAGFTPASLVRVAEPDGTLDIVSPLSNANYTQLLALINGTSTLYTKQSATAGSVVATASGNVGTPSAGSVWLDTALGNLKFYDGTVVKTLNASGGTGTVTSVATGTGLTGGPVMTTGTISLATLGLGGTGFKVTYDTYGRVTGAVALVEADIPTLSTSGKVVGSAITSGTIGGTTAINTSGTISSGAITSSGLITSPSLSSTAIGTQSAQIFETTNSFKVTLQAPPSLAANYALTLPTTTGSSGQVLTTNGSGVTSWSTALTSATGFVNGGNSFGAASNIGNNDNFDLNVKTNNLARVTVQAGGNVGIGTTSPVSTLDVAGEIRASNGGLFATGVNSNTGPQISLQGSGPAYGQLFYVGGSPDRFALGYGPNRVNPPTPVLTWSASGNVGIGTTSPAVMLDVNGAVKLGSGGSALSSIGICTTAASGTPISQNLSCANVPLGAVVHCVPSADPLALWSTYASGTSTITIRFSATPSGTPTWKCSWVN